MDLLSMLEGLFVRRRQMGRMSQIRANGLDISNDHTTFLRYFFEHI